MKDKFCNQIVNKLQINDIYREYFEQLYQSDITTPNHDSTNQKAELFLKNINIPTVADKDQKNLEQEITGEDINSGIRQMAAGKSPGIDGLPQEFYLAFQNKLTPLLISHYNEVLQNGFFSPSSNTASIILIPK